MIKTPEKKSCYTIFKILTPSLLSSNTSLTSILLPEKKIISSIILKKSCEMNMILKHSLILRKKHFWSILTEFYFRFLSSIFCFVVLIVVTLRAHKPLSIFVGSIEIIHGVHFFKNRISYSDKYSPKLCVCNAYFFRENNICHISFCLWLCLLYFCPNVFW